MKSHPTLLVADASRRRELKAAVRGPVVEMDDYYQAMGHMAHEPASAVVGAVEPLEAEPIATARVLRRMAPRARLLLVAESDQEPIAQSAVAEGFDDYGLWPVDRRWLDASLGGERRHANGSIEKPTSTQRHAATALSEGPGQVGDEPLLEKLSAGEDLTDTALALIRSRSGDETCRLVFDDGGGGVVLGPPAEGMGVLRSDGLDDRQLRPHAQWLAHWLGLQRRFGDLNDQARRDPLTGLWNRRHFDQRFAELLADAEASGHELTLMLYDIDGFKTFNDQCGHAAGDRVLQETARLMASMVRREDVVARIGGDEFAVLLTGPRSPSDVGQLVGRFQMALRQSRFPRLADRSLGALTVSAGLVCYPREVSADPEAMLAEADRRLYAAKAEGRDTLRFGPQTP